MSRGYQSRRELDRMQELLRATFALDDIPLASCRLTIRGGQLSLGSMQAWLMDDYKGIGGLRLADAPDPVPHPDKRPEEKRGYGPFTQRKP